MSFGIKEGRYAEENHKPEEIVAKLRQVNALVSQGKNIADAVRQIDEKAVAGRLRDLGGHGPEDMGRDAVLFRTAA